MTGPDYEIRKKNKKKKKTKPKKPKRFKSFDELKKYGKELNKYGDD